MRILLLTIMMMIAASASAGLYKWVDNEGNVHYSQKPPRDKQFKQLKAPPAPENTKPLYQSNEQSKPTGETNKTIAVEKAKIEKLKNTNCTRAKKSLSSYTVYSRFKDKDGNVITIDDEERARQIENAKKAIQDYCQ